MSALTAIITAEDRSIRNQALDAFCEQASLEQLLAECTFLEEFRRSSPNVYEQSSLRSSAL